MNAESEGVSYTATRERIHAIIEDCIDLGTLKSQLVTLKEVNTIIARTFKKNLGEYDSLYVEKKYIEILVEKWIVEDCALVVDIIDPNCVLNVIEDLTLIEKFSDCLRVIEQFNPVYTKLLLQESHTSERLRTREKQLVGRFKCECLNLVLLSTDWIRDELQFLRSFSDAINYTKDLAKFWQAIGVRQFIDISCQQHKQHSALRHLLSELQSSALSCSRVEALKQAANNIATKQKYFFVEKLRELIVEYMKPVDITASVIDGRSVLEVSGKHIVFSKELEKLQTHPDFTKVEEIRFVRAEAIHADVDLKASYWHGKNIVVYSEMLIVQEDISVIWDVSGRDAAESYTRPAGTSFDGIGLEGDTGEVGESGGNVTVIASMIDNAQNLRVVSSGGQGGKGQAGGSGEDGPDGRYIDQQKFRTHYPPASKFFDSKKSDTLNVTKTSIFNCLQSITSFRFGCSDELADNNFTKDDFKQQFSKCVDGLTSFYIEVDTDTGGKILFSFYEGAFLSPCQSFLLYKGEYGHEGKPGGVGGLGGNGGFSGEIDVQVVDHLNSNIKLNTINGVDGKQGEMGTHGKPGKNGLDIGYADCTVALWGQWPKTYILNPDDNKQLEPRYSNDSSSESIYCAHNSMYATISTERSQAIRQKPTQYRLVRLTSSTQERTQQHTLKVTRKKTINKDSIRERYHQRSSVANLFKLEECIDKAKEMLEKIFTEESLELEQVTTESKVVRLKNFSSISYLTEEPTTTSYYVTEEGEEQEQQSVELLIEQLKNNPGDVNVWCILQKQRLDATQVQELWNIVPANRDFTQVVHIELCHKYQLAVLRWLATESSTCLSDESQQDSHNKFSYTDSIAQSNLDRLLTIDNSKEPHSVLQIYFCEDSVEKRKEIVSQCEESLDDQSWGKCFESFLLEFADTKGEHSILAQVQKRFTIFKKKTNKEVENTFIPLKNVLDQANNQHVYNWLLESLVKQSTTAKINVEIEIAKDKFFKHLYSFYVKSTNSNFDWNKFPEASHLKNSCFQTMYDEGPRARCYRELLALLFKTNILLYSTNESNEMFLLGNHNPKAKDTVYFLKKEDKYLRLIVDKGFEKMLGKHKAQGELYSKLLFHVDSLTEKEQFDQFISENTFKSNNYNGVDKSTRMNVKIKQLLRQDHDIDTILSELKPLLSEDKRSLMRNKVEKLKFEFSGCEDILYYMALHLHSEGIQISVKELCYIINCVLRAAAEGAAVLSLASWIIASQLQTQWLAELTLLQLELCFKAPLATEQIQRWRSYLHDFKEKETLMLFLERISDDICTASMECIECTLHLLSRIPKVYIGLDKLDLEEWKYHLKDRFWAQEISTTADWSQEELKRASYYMVAMENAVGSDMCKKLVGLMRKHHSEIDCEEVKHVIFYTLRMMTNLETSISDKLVEQLSSSKILSWQSVIEEHCFISDYERSLSQLVELIRNSDNTSSNIVSKLDHTVSCINHCDSLMKKLKQYINDNNKLSTWISRLLKVIRNNNKDNKNEENSISFLNKVQICLNKFNDKVFDDTIRSLFKGKFSSDFMGDDDSQSTESDCLKSLLKEGHDDILFATVITAINMTFDIELRPTQKLTIMTMLSSSTNVLGQVSTGEGKSFIVVTVAIMKAVLGQKVDIITSSRVLAKRDSKEYNKIYSLFGINVGHNCSEDLEERKKEYSKKQVIYGELGNFQRDYLLDCFYNKNVLGDRTFETVLVDEVDSMLLDKGNNMLYLSHDIPGLDRLQPLFLLIWKLLNLSLNEKTQIDIVSVKESILDSLFGVIRQEDIKDLDRTLSDTQVNNTWEGLIKLKIINSAGHVLKDEINDNCLDTLYTKPGNYCVNKNHMIYLLKNVSERKRSVEVPNHLKEFVETHLEEWLESALRAMSMESGVDYVLDVDRSGGVGGVSNQDRAPNVMLVDRDTGTDLVNSQWDGGLHQFLQIKHGCRLSPLSLKAVFVSNVKYFKQYKTLHGLTGTLGSRRERQLLTDIYNVKFVTIPTAKPKCFHEEIPILCSSTEHWLKEICDEVYKETLHRSVLVVCETVNDVMTMKRMFSHNKFSQRRVYIYKRDYEQFDVAAYLEPGCIIVSTNLAGRGTDIKLSRELIHAGGLHVCLTFLPSNGRVEEQAFGRAARNGEPGSARLIFHKDNNKQETAARIIDLKKKRDVEELLRVVDIKRYHETRIKQEEKCFQKFNITYSKLSNASTHSEDVKLILLHTALNEWALCLDKHSRHFSPESINQINNFLEDIKKLNEDSFETWSNQIRDPNQLIKLGVIFIGKKEYAIALNFFERVITEEPSFSEIARYYRVLTKAALTDCTPEDLINELKYVGKQLSERIQCSMISAHLIDWLKERSPTSVLQIESFKEQQHNISKTYEIFLHSIFKSVGHNISSKLIAAQLNIDDRLADVLFNDLLKEGVIRGPRLRVKPCIREKELKFSTNYGMPPGILSEILNKCFDYEQITKELKNEYKLPSRELFWKELLLKGVLTKEEKYSYVDVEKLSCFDPSLKEELKFLEQATPPAGPLWLYRSDEMRTMVQSRHQLVFKTSTIINVLKTLYRITDETAKMRLKLFKRNSIITSNRHASFAVNLTEEMLLCHFDSLSVDDFFKMGIAKNVAVNIIAELQEKGVVKCTHSLAGKNMYSLLQKFEDIESIELTTHKKYSNDVQNVLATCFAFRIALQNLVCEKADELCLYLPVKLHRQIASELQSLGIIQEPIIDPGKNISDVLKKFYSSAKSEQEICNLLKQLYGNDNIVKDIFKELVRGKYLKEEDSCLDKIKAVPYLINGNEKPIFYSISLPIQLNNATSPPPNALLQKNFKSIAMILSDHKELSTLVADKQKPIQNMLVDTRGEIYTLATPFFSLQPLMTLLENHNLPMTEYSTFSLNGFDQVLVLTEKKYTYEMMKRTLGLFILAVTEIVVGYLLLPTICSPFGSRLVMEGMNDIIDVANHMFSGYCTYEELCLKKVLSLGLNLLTALSGAMFKSSKSFVKLFTRTKSISPQLSVTVKRVMLCTAEAVGQGLTYATFDHVIQPHCEKVGEVIISKIMYTDIDQTLKTHSVTKCIDELIQKLGHRALVTIKTCLKKVIDIYTNKIGTGWNRNISLFKTVVNQHILKPMQQNKKVTQIIGSSNLEWIGSLNTAFLSLQKAIQSSQALYVTLTTMTSDILRKLEEMLKSTLRQVNHNRLDVNINVRELRTLTHEVHKDIEGSIKQIVVDQVKEKVIRPVLHYTQNNLISYTSKFVAKRYSSFFSDQEAEELVKLRKNMKPIAKTKGGDNLLHPTFVDIQHEKCLLDLLRKRRSAALYVDMLKKNAPMDLSCLQLCCSIIPQALRRAGIYVPKLRLVVQRNGVTQEWSTGRDAECLTVYFNRDGDFVSNLQNNKTLVRNVCNGIYNAILLNNPQYRGYTADIIHQVVIRVLDHDFDYIQDFINIFFKNDDNSPNAQWTGEEYHQLNVAAEEVDPCEHSLPDMEWIFNPSVDIDLRTEYTRKKFSHSKPVNKLIIEGYMAALNKINNHIANPQYGLYLPFILLLEDFEKTNHEIGPQTDKCSGSHFDCYVSHYELVLPLLVEINEMQEEVEFRVMMTLKRRVEEIPLSPRGPHIFYELTPCNALHLLGAAIRGHILLDSECRSVMHSVSNCQSVGEVILPTLVRHTATVKNTQRVLILGDSMFKHLSKYVSQPTYAIQCFNDKKPNDLRDEISAVIRQYPSAKCVVLYFGMFVLKYKMTEDEVSGEINQVISLIRSQLTDVKVILCSIALRKQISEKFANGKHKTKIQEQIKTICRTIQHLRTYFGERNVTFWETNTYLKPEDLSKDGVHLNELGNRKMGFYISKVAIKSMRHD